MKSRGIKLERHYDKIFDYWTHIVPHRPPYAILCNFDEFWIYDFNQQLFDPVEKIALAELPQRAEALAFLLPAPRKPLFNNNRVEVTREAASDLADWPKADAIVGNPPYLGSRYVAQELGYDYAKRVQERFPDVPKMADFCTHWFPLAHDALPDNGRAGLVGTNTIRQNEGREASLDFIVKHGGTITDAVSTQVWSGDAAVHVSIVNWLKGNDLSEKKLTTQQGDHVNSPWSVEELPTNPPTLSSSFNVRVDRLSRATKTTPATPSSTPSPGRRPRRGCRSNPSPKPPSRSVSFTAT